MKRLISFNWIAISLLAFLFIVEGCIPNPFQSRTTTVFGTITDNDTKLPLEGIRVVVYGQTLLSTTDELAIIQTGKSGQYFATIEVPAKFHALGVWNEYDDNQSLAIKYRGYLTLLNNQQTRDCCRVDVGSKTQYDFVMLTK